MDYARNAFPTCPRFACMCFAAALLFLTRCMEHAVTVSYWSSSSFGVPVEPGTSGVTPAGTVGVASEGLGTVSDGMTFGGILSDGVGMMGATSVGEGMAGYPVPVAPGPVTPGTSEGALSEGVGVGVAESASVEVLLPEPSP
jgi:hypothetical protein